MAFGNKPRVVETITADELRELQERAAQAEKFSPEKLVIVAGSPFGTSLKFLLLGAAIGAAVVMLLQGRGTYASGEDAVYEGVSGGGAKDTSVLAARVEGLLRRAKSLAYRARDAAQSVAEHAQQGKGDDSH